MAKQTINVGSSANKGDGDPLRTAFGKINENFTEVYSLLGASDGDTDDVIAPMLVHSNHTNVTVTRDDDANLIIFSVDQAVTDLKGSVFADDSTLLVDGVDSSINLDGTVKGNIVPDANEAYDLGSTTNRFRDLYLSGSTIDLGGTTLSIVGGNLQIGGTDIKDVVTAAGIDYTDIQNTPTIPTAVSDLTNDTGFITSASALTAGSNIPTLEAAYTAARGTLDVLLSAADYGAQLAPPSDYTYYEIALRQKALNPLIPDEVVDEALNVLNAYNAWQNEIEAETATITVGDREWKFKGDGTVDGLNVDGDITGSVFGDDSTLLVDGVNSKINLQNTVLNNTISTINDEALYLNTATIPGDRGGRITTTDNIFDIYGATLPDGNGGGVWLAGGLADPGKQQGDVIISGRFISLRGGDGAGNGGIVFNGPVVGRMVGDIQGSVFADDSSTLVDGVNGTIPGYVSIATLKTIVAASLDFNDFQTRIAAL
jgi:hypothetical protein